MSDPYLGYEIALLVVLVYAVIVYALYRRGLIGPDHPLTLMGPALMIKTQRGRTAIERWARFKRFWTVVSDVGVALAAIAMAAIIVLLIIDAIISLRLSPSSAPSPSEALGIPGINPIIPIGYGIVALVVGIVLHELAHGVVARSQGIGVKSLGILWCVIPVGAFVEQDDNDMQAASRRRRDRVAAAGVLANFGLTLIFFVALSLLVAGSVQPNANGVGVAVVESGSPAANATLAPGDIILSINGTSTTTATSFEDALEDTHPGQVVTVVYWSGSNSTVVTTRVTLAQSPTVATRGFLGVAVTFLTPSELKTVFVSPLSSDQGPLVGGIDWLVLPLAGLQPVQGTTVGFYHLTGPLSGVNPQTFWVIANVLYWLAWMNLLLGLSNALPLVPLDGGLLFRDFAASIAARFRKGWDAAHLERFGAQAVTASSLIVLLLLVWQFVVPHLL